MGIGRISTSSWTPDPKWALCSQRPPLLALFGVLSPLGRKVESELRRRLGDVTLDWRELRASDLSGRARAFQSMVGAGMDLSKAASIAGLMVQD